MKLLKEVLEPAGFVWRSTVRDEMKKTETSIWELYLLLRLAVGFLGERSQFNWWDTSFFDSSSGAFLRPIFAKSGIVVRYQGVRAAGQRIHDKSIGIGSVYHLFRLPEQFEQRLFTLISHKQSDFEQIVNKLVERKDGLQLIEELSDGVENSEGPIRAGEIDAIMKMDSLRRLCRLYLGAFNDETRVYPYFSD